MPLLFYGRNVAYERLELLFVAPALLDVELLEVALEERVRVLAPAREEVLRVGEAERAEVPRPVERVVDGVAARLAVELRVEAAERALLRGDAEPVALRGDVETDDEERDEVEGGVEGDAAERDVPARDVPARDVLVLVLEPPVVARVLADLELEFSADDRRVVVAIAIEC